MAEAVEKYRDGGGTIEGLLPDYGRTSLKQISETNFRNMVMKNLPKGEISTRLKMGIKEATHWMANSLHDNAYPLRNVKHVFMQDGIRSYYVEASRSIHWAGSARALIHEYGHHLHDYGSAELKNVVKGFFRSRTAGEELVRIYAGKDEMAFVDKFFNSYVGKVYASELPGLGNGTEVVSMGLEVMHSNTKQFFERDREHFNLILGILRGVFK